METDDRSEEHADRNDGIETLGSLSRRSFVGLAAASLAAGVAASLPGCTPTQQQAPGSNKAAEPEESPVEKTNEATPVKQPAGPVRYDIVDNHLHYLDFLQNSDGFPALIEAMDASGVSQSVIFGMAMAKQWDEDTAKAPSYYLSNDSRCYYYSATDYMLLEDLAMQPEEVRNRFFPFVCGINPNDRFAVDHIKRVVERYPHTIAGIGELMSRHDDLTALTYGEPPHLDHPAFFEIFDYAAEQGFPVLVHHNITAVSTPEILYLEELENALAHNRDCKIIWAHIGISRRIEVPHLASIADGLLTRNGNLWIDISWIVYNYYFLEESPDDFEDGDTLDDWAALMEKWPDRFMIGTDKVGHWETYGDEVMKYYSLLDKLSPETAQKLCRDNILSLVKIY